MSTITYQIEFSTYWHTGSGLSGGVDANLAVIKDEHELPFIPGRTMKGLLREAAEMLNELNTDLVSKDFIATVFGIGEDQSTNGEYRAGQCFFSNAMLSKYLTDHLQSHPEKGKMLFTTIASTAINEKGIAKNQTLRQLEVTIPLSLYATIESFPDDQEMVKQLNYCFQWIKKMGTNRTRGLGRCAFSQIKPD